MKTLIIAEKPSLAKNICAAIKPKPVWKPGKSRNCGHYENDEYIVSYAFGHLLRLKDAEDYDEEYKRWNIKDLPIVPSTFSYKTPKDAGSKAQLSLLKTLINRKDVDKVVNAGDSDREGEIIIRNILDYARNKKPVYRLWMPDQTSKTIKAELAKMTPDSNYDNLANEGYARTYIDWLYGINLTRLATKKAGRLLRVGRVTSPIVMAICQRERDIRNFKPEKYYVPTHKKDGLELVSETRCKTKKESDGICEKYNKAKTVVSEAKTERKTLPRPKLFALSDLQGAVGSALKYSPKQTLDIVQSLYEAGYVTYPRTDSRYMAENEKAKAKSIIAAMQKAGITNADKMDFRNDKSIFDSSKVEAHSAITPTHSIPNLPSLTREQRSVYTIIANRFIAAFCKEDYTVDRTTLVIDNGFELFKVTGDILVTKGYTEIEPTNKKDSHLPPLKKGDGIDASFVSAEKETLPPPHYTADGLNTYLKNPFSAQEKKDITTSDEETKEVIGDVELGTEATRAGLIDSAIKSGYITFIKNRYGITDLGERYTDSLVELGIDMTKKRTLELSKSLKQIYKGTQDKELAVTAAIDDLRDICSHSSTVTVACPETKDRTEYIPKRKEDTMAENALCKCPKCGKDIVEYKTTFACEDRECGCVIFKDDRFFSAAEKKMTPYLAKELFTKGYADVKGLKSKKTGKLYDARVKADFSGKYVNYTLEFPNS